MAKGSGGTKALYPQGSAGNNTIVISANGVVEEHPRIAAEATARLKKILEEKEEKGYSTDANNFKFGRLSSIAARKFEELTGIAIQNKDMYTGQKALFHHRGGDKAEAGKEADLEDIIQMPMNIGKMDVFVHTGALVFTDYKNKYVVQPNQKVKINREKVIVTNHVSSSKVKDASDFVEEKGYKKIIL